MNIKEQETLASKDIFDRMRSGKLIRLDDAQYPSVQVVINRTVNGNCGFLRSFNGINMLRKP